MDGCIVFVACGVMAIILAYISYRRGYNRGFHDGYKMRDSLALWERLKNENL